MNTKTSISILLVVLKCGKHLNLVVFIFEFLVPTNPCKKERCSYWPILSAAGNWNNDTSGKNGRTLSSNTITVIILCQPRIITWLVLYPKATSHLHSYWTEVRETKAVSILFLHLSNIQNLWWKCHSCRNCPLYSHLTEALQQYPIGSHWARTYASKASPLTVACSRTELLVYEALVIWQPLMCHCW